MTPLAMIQEWRKGCSCASKDRPEECLECTRALIDHLEPALEKGLELAPGVRYTERKLVEGVLRNMAQQNLGRHRRPRWAVITKVFAVGSGVARGLCREFGYDPEEMI